MIGPLFRQRKRISRAENKAGEAHSGVAGEEGLGGSMNTQFPCRECRHLYVDCAREDDPTYQAECYDGYKPDSKGKCIYFKQYDHIIKQRIRDLASAAIELGGYERGSKACATSSWCFDSNIPTDGTIIHFRLSEWLSEKIYIRLKTADECTYCWATINIPSEDEIRRGK